MKQVVSWKVLFYKWNFLISWSKSFVKNVLFDIMKQGGRKKI